MLYYTWGDAQRGDEPLPDWERLASYRSARGPEAELFARMRGIRPYPRGLVMKTHAWILSIVLAACSTPPPPQYTWNSTDTTHLYMKSVSFIDAKKGWMAGGLAARGASASGAIWETSTGGQTWFPDPLPQPVDVLNSIFFVTPSEGWAVGEGGVVLHTLNAGLIWTLQFFSCGASLSLRRVVFIDPQHGWMVGGSCIFTSSNGGGSWTPYFASANVFDVHFVDVSNGWAVGEHGLILVTTSGGGTGWGHQNAPRTDRDLRSVFFIDTLTGFAGGGDGYTAADDDGCSWVSTNPPRRQCPAAYGPPHRTLFKTVNHGRQWTQVFDDPEQPIQRIVFRGPNSGWIAGGTEYHVSQWELHPSGVNGIIMASKDGGATWVTQSVGVLGFQPPVYDLWFVNDTIAFAVGANTGIKWDGQHNRYSASPYCANPFQPYCSIPPSPNTCSPQTCLSASSTRFFSTSHGGWPH